MPIPPPRPAITQRQTIRMLAVLARAAFAVSWPPDGGRSSHRAGVGGITVRAGGIRPPSAPDMAIVRNLEVQPRGTEVSRREPANQHECGSHGHGAVSDRTPGAGRRG